MHNPEDIYTIEEFIAILQVQGHILIRHFQDIKDRLNAIP